MNQYELGDALAVPFFMELTDKIKQYETNVVSGYEMNDLQKLAFMTTFRRVLVSLLFVSIVKGITAGMANAERDEDKAAQILITAMMEDLSKKFKAIYPNIEFLARIQTKDKTIQDGEL